VERFLMVVGVLFFALVHGAQAQPGQPRQVTEHVATMYGGVDGVVLMWNKPIRYRIYGEPTPDQLREFDQIMEKAKQITGLDIAAAPTNDECNMYLIMTRTIEVWLTDKKFAEIFTDPGETSQAFEARMKDVFAKGSIARTSSDESTTLWHVAIGNIDRWNDPSMLMHALAVTALTQARSSQGTLSVKSQPAAIASTEFTPIDQLFLSAYYNSGVQHKEGRREAFVKIIKHMLENMPQP
jgi:hypothetical protein